MKDNNGLSIFTINFYKTDFAAIYKSLLSTSTCFLVSSLCYRNQFMLGGLQMANAQWNNVKVIHIGSTPAAGRTHNEIISTVCAFILPEYVCVTD